MNGTPGIIPGALQSRAQVLAGGEDAARHDHREAPTTFTLSCLERGRFGVSGRTLSLKTGQL
jgi:hypothetical protein